MLKALVMCPTCKSQTHRNFLKNCHDVVCDIPGQWSLVECAQCGLIYTVPPLRQEELQNYYLAEYSPYHPVKRLRANPVGNLIRRATMFPYILRFGSPDWAERPFGEGRLLDVGCGAGIFLKEACRLGWRCWGIDISPEAVQIARENAPETTVWTATLDDIDSGERFDLINMNHVIEHLLDPQSALKQCFNLLAPGGKVHLSLPNIGSLEAKVFGRYWRGLDMPRHLVHFREPVLKQHLGRAGFSNVRIRPAMHVYSISDSLILILPKPIRSRLLVSRVARLLYLSMIFPASLSYFLGNRGTIEVVAQKPK